jgi:hypothetical protein
MGWVLDVLEGFPKGEMLGHPVHVSGVLLV